MSKDMTHKIFFDQQAEKWDAQETPEAKSRLAGIFKEFNHYFEGNILDIGCGTGILVPFLRDQLENDNRLVELDFSINMLKKNKLKWQSKSKKLNWINSDVYHLPFIGSYFHIVICFAVLPHVAYKDLAIKELNRVTAQGGYMVVLHLMSSRRLNQYHAGVSETVHRDYLPPLEELTEIVKMNGYQIKKGIEKEDLYLILARKV